MRVRSRFAELQHLDEKDGRVPWHVVGKLLHGYMCAHESSDIVSFDIAGIVCQHLLLLNHHKTRQKVLRTCTRNLYLSSQIQ